MPKTRYWTYALALAAMSITLAAVAQIDRPAGTPGRPPAGMPGPWDQDVHVYRVGASGVARVATFERAGVPTLARLADGRLIAAHQHFPADDDATFDKVAVHFSSDEGATWSGAQAITLTGLPEGMRSPFDPTLVPLPDGRVRLYFTSLRGLRFEESTPAIYSAVSADGLRYVFEPGMRFGVEGRPVIDCAVALHQGVFHLYAPDNGARAQGQRPGQVPPDSGPRAGVGYHATSTDGLNFSRASDVRIEGRRHWLGNVQSDGAQLVFIGTEEQGRVWMAASGDGQNWRLTESLAIPGADPGAVKTRSGEWLIIATAPPRPGTPSAQRGRRPPEGHEAPRGPPRLPELPGGGSGVRRY